MYRIFVAFLALLLSGCLHPLRVSDGNMLYIDYDRIQNAIICHLIDAWKLEYDYHNRKLPDYATVWVVELTLKHSRSGSLGASASGKKNTIHHSWKKEINTGLNPSDTSTYELASNLDLTIPQDFFTEASMNAGAVTTDYLQLTDTQKTICEDDKYVNLDQMGILPHFNNYIKGYPRESGDEQLKYTNLTFENTGQLVASLGGNFTYALVPYTVVLPPLASYTDKIYLKALVTRLRLSDYRKKIARPKPARVTIDNNFITMAGSVTGNIYITNMRELACHLKDTDNIPAIKKCIEAYPKQTPPSSEMTIQQFGGRRATPPSITAQPPSVLSEPTISSQPKGPRANSDLERQRQLIDDIIEDRLK